MQHFEIGDLVWDGQKSYNEVVEDHFGNFLRDSGSVEVHLCEYNDDDGTGGAYGAKPGVCEHVAKFCEYHDITSFLLTR